MRDGEIQCNFMELVDVPILGNKFTWFSFDGLACSSLDKFLASKDLIIYGGTWPEKLDQGISQTIVQYGLILET